MLIDGGSPKQGATFVRGLETLSIRPEDIRLMVITCGHCDHIGSAKEIKEITGTTALGEATKYVGPAGEGRLLCIK